MIGILLFAQAATAQPGTPPDLVELARIVAPYAECEFKRRDEVKAAYDRWLPAVQRKNREPSNTSAAAEAKTQMDRLEALQAEIRTTCGYEEAHQRLRQRLGALHPKMDEPQAFWLARGVFNQFNRVNEQLVRMKAGVFPAAPPPPPPVPRSATGSK